MNLSPNVAGTPTAFTAQCAGGFTPAEEAEILADPAPLVPIKAEELQARISECEQMPEPKAYVPPTRYGYSYYSEQ